MTQVAQTIFNQFGGGRSCAMIGANKKEDRLAGENSLTIRFREKARNKANRVRITLNMFDTYDVEFIRVWGSNVKEIETVENVYCDQLMDVFEHRTGIFLTFRPRR